jgi:myo-inositol catabolism protein IolC
VADLMSTTPSRDAGRLLFILAVDHRASLERDLYKLTSPPTPAQAERIVADKLLVYQGLLEAVTELAARAQPGILIDEHYGASVAELAGNTGGQIDLSMPVEESGQDWFTFEYGDRWQEHASLYNTSHTKVLVRDNPAYDGAKRERQADLVAQVSAWSAANHRPLILELLVPATPADLQTVNGDTARYDAEVRPRLTIDVMTFLQDRGVQPALWKVEGLDHHDDAVAISATAQRSDANARCIILGRHASHDQLDRWLQIAAPVDGFVGFAIGRSIWWDALHSHLRHFSTAKDVVQRVRDNYLDFARYYLSAREGRLGDPSEPLWG